IDAGASGEPYAYVIPPGQWDPGAAARLVEVLRIGGIDVQRAGAEFTAGGRTFPSGSIVVPMAQPFRAYAKDLLEPQRYPDLRQYPNGPPLRPYDITGWTLPAQMGVEGLMVAKPFQAALQPVAAGPVEAGGVSGTGSVFVAPARANAAYLLANRVLKAGGEVSRAKTTFQAGGVSFEAGAFILKGGLDRGAVETLARERGLRVAAVEGAPGVDLARVRPLRVGVYKPWVPTIDEGWTRWLLEQFEFPYRTITDADVRRGGLEDALDVIVIPDVERAQPTRTLLEGNAPGTVPPEYTGGLGLEGALALKDFVRAGGTLVTLDSASDFAIDLFGLGVRNVLRGLSSQEYYAPGGLLRITADPSQPLAWGLPPNVVAFVENGPAFEQETEREEGEELPAAAPNARAAARIAARFADKDVLYSGWLLGESRIARKAALVEVPLDKGRVVLIGFRPQFRGQSHATFKVLFNALMRGAGD
ncbi:MAG TPA: peptidase M14, partial [Vicinamibacteria bacterium]|nr:peptidase M14 [Vicinamibacteria bacterium]